MANPLEDENWVRGLGNEIHDYVTKLADERDRTSEQRHRELVQIHRDGWRQMADALRGGLGLIADAIRDHGRR